MPTASERIRAAREAQKRPAFEADSIGRDETIDAVVAILLDAVGYGDSFEARDFGRKLVDDALTQWMNLDA